MKIPPVHLDLFDLRRTVHLVAFVDYLKLGMNAGDETGFFLAFYIKPGKATVNYYLILVDEGGVKQRRLTEAGDCIEYATIVATAMFPITVMDIMAYQVVCNETLFRGHLPREMASYRKELAVVRKRLEKLKRSYWRASFESQR